MGVRYRVASAKDSIEFFGNAKDCHNQTHKETEMAHKKVERRKELDRKRKRRMERLKLRVKEAKGAASK